jgi:hypothetical protein
MKMQKPTVVLGLPFLFIAILIFASPTVVHAQYSLRRSSLSTIGGKSTGGAFSLRSAVGVTAAGSVAGGSFSVTSTPWSLVAVETPGAPSLRIYLTNSTTVVVAWPSPSTGWLLQQNTNRVGSANWSNVTATIQDDGTIRRLIVSPPTGSRFFRLFKPQ